jgi:hypothetical protein
LQAGSWLDISRHDQDFQKHMDKIRSFNRQLSSSWRTSSKTPQPFPHNTTVLGINVSHACRSDKPLLVSYIFRMQYAQRSSSLRLDSLTRSPEDHPRAVADHPDLGTKYALGVLFSGIWKIITPGLSPRSDI